MKSRKTKKICDINVTIPQFEDCPLEWKRKNVNLSSQKNVQLIAHSVNPSLQNQVYCLQMLTLKNITRSDFSSLDGLFIICFHISVQVCKMCYASGLEAP